jgi:hypothetical protein
MRFLIPSFNSDSKNPLDEATPESLVSWAKINPHTRFPLIASAITLFRNDDTGAIVWTPTALQVLDLSPDRIAVLTGFRSQFYPNAWGGSLANILESRRLPLRALLTYPDQTVVSWARDQDAALGRRAETERLREGLMDRQTDQSFE